jgi:hypothetical protein
MVGDSGGDGGDGDSGDGGDSGGDKDRLRGTDGTEVGVDAGRKDGGDDDDDDDDDATATDVEAGAEIFRPTVFGGGSGRHAVTFRSWCEPWASEHAMPHPQVGGDDDDGDASDFFDRCCRRPTASSVESRHRAHRACRYDSGWKRRSLMVWARRHRSPSGHLVGDCHTPLKHTWSHGRDS